MGLANVEPQVLHDVLPVFYATCFGIDQLRIGRCAANAAIEACVLYVPAESNYSTPYSGLRKRQESGYCPGSMAPILLLLER